MSVLQKIQDLARRKMHSHAMYNHMLELGKTLGRDNLKIPEDRVRNILMGCNINDLDYVLSGLFRGHQLGLEQWRIKILNVERKARLELDKSISKKQLGMRR